MEWGAAAVVTKTGEGTTKGGAGANGTKGRLGAPPVKAAGDRTGGARGWGAAGPVPGTSGQGGLFGVGTVRVEQGRQRGAHQRGTVVADPGPAAAITWSSAAAIRKAVGPGADPYGRGEEFPSRGARVHRLRAWMNLYGLPKGTAVVMP